MTSKARPVAHPKLTPLPDPPEHERDMQQLPYIAETIMTLRAYYRHTLGRSDVLVNGEGYLCPRAGLARTSPRPDCLVALNLPIAPETIEWEANGYTIEEIGQPPDFVLEVGSKTGGFSDHTRKRVVYAALEVQEYWRFDPTGGIYHDAPLAGDVLVGGSYEPIPIEARTDGVHRGYCAALGLELHWVENKLRFYEPAEGQYLPNQSESLAQRDEAQDRARSEEERALRAEARVRELEEELRRLRGS